MTSALIVEDSPTQAAEIAFVLEDAGFQPTVAESGVAALDLLSGTTFDVMVFDVILPQISGYELCRKVRAQLAPRTPILLLTTLDEPADILRGSECGANAYMNKPWEAENLVQALKSLIGATPGTAAAESFDEASKAEYLRSVVAHYSRRQRCETNGQSHDALRRSEEMFALAAIGANDGLWDWDLDSDTFHTTPRWKEIVGVPAHASAHPGLWFDRVHPADRERIEAELQAHLEGCLSQFENQHRILQRDGRSRWVLVRGRSMRGSDGEAHRMAGSLTDISEQKAIEERLLRSTAEFNGFLSLFPELLLHLDRAGTVLARHGGSDLVAKLPLFTGLRIDVALPASATRCWQRAMDQARATGRTATFAFSMRVAGDPCDFEVRLSPVADERIVAVVYRDAPLRAAPRRAKRIAAVC